MADKKEFERSFRVGEKGIGEGYPCFVVAEAGVSHFGDLEKALALVDSAVHAGADAVKFQIFKTDEMISSTDREWRERMRCKELSLDAFRAIRDYCRAKGILFFATAHDPKGLEMLSCLNPPMYKIGSGEVRNPNYFSSVAALGKPVIFSTGMYARRDLDESLDALLAGGCTQVAALHCVTCYPTPPEAVNLRRIKTLKEIFPGPVGYSDHCATFDIAAAAVLLGAKIIEKHITIEKNIPNAQDWKVACDPFELKEFVASIRRLEAAQGTGEFQPADVEQPSTKWARKSVVATSDLAAGTVLESRHLTAKRPGTGFSPNEMPRLLGRRLRIAISADEVVTEDHFEKN